MQLFWPYKVFSSLSHCQVSFTRTYSAFRCFLIGVWDFSNMHCKYHSYRYGFWRLICAYTSLRYHCHYLNYKTLFHHASYASCDAVSSIERPFCAFCLLQACSALTNPSSTSLTKLIKPCNYYPSFTSAIKGSFGFSNKTAKSQNWVFNPQIDNWSLIRWLASLN